MRIRSVLALVLLGVACAGPGAGMTAYVGAELFDGTGAPVIHDAVVIIADGRIEAAGPPDLVKVPRGADVTNTRRIMWVVSRGMRYGPDELRTP